MRIEYIKFKNYRQFRDEKIDLTNSKKDIVVIEGAMDAGKSMILNAITWCLYGEEIQLDTESKGYPILNIKVLNKMKPDQIEKVEVEIMMRDEENKKHFFTRTINVKKGKGKNEAIVVKDPLSIYPDGSDFTYLICEEGKGEVQRQPSQYFLEQIMPSVIKEYFFFDGDQLNLYFQSASGEKIKKAVFDISQITLLELVIDRLENKKRDILKSQKDLGTGYEETKELLDTYDRSKTDLRRAQVDLSEKKDKLSALVNDATQKLLTCGNVDVEELERQCEELKRDMKNIDSTIKEAEKEKLDHLTRHAPFILAYDKILKARRLVAKADIPAPFKKDFIEGLLEKGLCICGTNLKRNKEACDKLNKVLAKTCAATNIESEVEETKGMLREAIDELKLFISDQTTYGRKIKNLVREYDDKNNNYNLTNSKIQSTDKGKLKELKSAQLKYLSQMSEVDIEIGVNITRLQEAEKRIRQYVKELQDKMEERKQSKELSESFELLDDAVKAANKIKLKIVDDVREKIRSETKKQFLQIHWKEESYENVEINDKYEISLSDPKGWETIGTISKGTRQVLALSFLAALNSISGFHAPIVIDTPLGRISGEPKLNIVKYLSKFLPNRQIILLMTDQEYTEIVRKTLLPRISKEYKIKVLESPEGSEAKVIDYE
ncbi:MAG: AAA family ATPase [Candidatus Aenigmarchaeota archaeon]|nr:AAA family ATPase [Candidatus Aenigmarchaeota archaeon]